MGVAASRMSVAVAAKILKVRVSELERCSNERVELRGKVPPKLFLSGPNGYKSFGMSEFLETYKDLLADPVALSKSQS